MKEKILKELEELHNTRIAVYTDGVQIITKDEENDIHEIILKNCSGIVYKNTTITNWNEILLEKRRLTFLVDDDYSCGQYPILEIDLTKGYIEIFKGFENRYIFMYKEFKKDQILDKDNHLDLDKYPILSYNIEESSIRKGYYEIIINVRMSPLDECDYKLRAFYPMSEDFTGALSIMEYYRNKIMNGEFAEFFRHITIGFTSSNSILKEDVIYDIVDYHFDEYYFTIKEHGKSDDEKINIPFIDIFDSIKYLDIVD